MLYDIFSKRKARKSLNKIRPKIVADIHEKDSRIFSELKHNPEIELEICSLKIGDYLVGDIIIERKTVTDLASSIISKRIFEQVAQLKSYPKRILILEGDVNGLANTKLNPNSVRGFILSLMINQNIPIIFTKDYFDTSRYLMILAKQQLKPMKEISLHSRIPKTLSEQKRYILEAFPNIGPAKAELLLKKFGSLNNVFNASEEELREVLRNNSKDFKDILMS